jgi:hypothetical protein
MSSENLRNRGAHALAQLEALEATVAEIATNIRELPDVELVRWYVSASKPSVKKQARRKSCRPGFRLAQVVECLRSGQKTTDEIRAEMKETKDVVQKAIGTLLADEVIRRIRRGIFELKDPNVQIQVVDKGARLWRHT